MARAAAATRYAPATRLIEVPVETEYREREYPRARSAMDSPGVLFFRVLVMLTCLILVPLAAVFGTAFPEVVRKQVIERFEQLSGFNLAGVNLETKAKEQQSQLSPPTETKAVKQAVATEEAPAWNAPAAPAEVREVAYQERAPLLAAPPAATGKPDHFSAMQAELKSLGATYYGLETWGYSGEQYRFHCKVKLASGQVQHFEATDRDAVLAMGNVVGQVRAYTQRGRAR